VWGGKKATNAEDVPLCRWFAYWYLFDAVS
jgi:hypothetical protein